MNELIQELKDSIGIIEVVEKLGLDLKPHGNSLLGDCITGHESKNGKCFGVNANEHYFNCFHCGVSGDIVKLVELAKGIDFKRAIQWLCENFRPDLLPQLNRLNGGTPKERPEYYQKADLYKRGRVWWCCYKDINERLVRETTQTQDYEKAIDFIMKRRSEIRAGIEPQKKKIVNHPFSELVSEYKKWAERQRSFYSKIHLINQLERNFGGILLKNFTPKLLEQYQTERLTKGNKPSTANRLRATLAHMFTKGYEWEMLSEETLKRVKKVRLLKENNRRLRYLSNDECQALINNCDSHLKPILTMALNTGCRRGEILKLKWDQVDLKHGFILLDITKNGERREIPINDTLRGVLQGLTRRLDVPYVFYDQATGKPYQDIKRSFHTALRRSGIRDFHFHDLRHTFASHLVMAGIDIATVKELLGHKTLTMTLRYAHLAPSHKVNAVNVLDRIINNDSVTSQ